MMKKRGKIIAAIVALVVVASVVGLALAGYLYIGIKSPGESISKRYSICGDEIVNKYNDYSNSGSEDAGALKEIIDSFTSNDNYKNDATCGYIALQYYMYGDRNKDQMNELLEQLEKLEEKGDNPSLKINNLVGLDYMKTVAGYINNGEYDNYVKENASR